MSRCPGPGGGAGSKWAQARSQDDGEVQVLMGTRTNGVALEIDVALVSYHLHHPEENFPPPLHTPPDERIVHCVLVSPVHSIHKAVVSVNHHWLQPG